MPAEDPTPKNIAQAITEVSEKASLLVREEIELAKAEISARVTKLVKGAIVGIAAGIFIVVGLLYLIESAAWGIWDLSGWGDNYWFGFLVVALLLFLLGGLAGALAYKAVKAGSPPSPEMAIEEAKKIKETVQSSGDDTPSVRGVS
ncbi:phage holin family protein [Conexibacter sp. JD483]|uniref:phage holin family protein n=1 Tax=unclassified Conexibacter TaxID=2627773 RepID=UPI002719045E|nr:MULTISPECIES: phage holin family protein [unclassified Conexibacter]MDO8186136.1 phage holin family protein [Conexibacter sp. CPCC 205706]MDO8199626.1 phage holin family protein [Conexibacter sp. CPCC 205762]MDR9369120.1 phage holin family protein [Conexibacter sp. JD483]